ncbi:class I SAM-dependent methyltransferase [Rhodobacteraceae bacterium CCMM004]|nr:class I SAM-dependent methyltransferase [Rhodobacteraceae bacterium CCMM004]
MSAQRLERAAHLLRAPLLVWGAEDPADLAALPRPLTVVQTDRVAHDALRAAGLDVVTAPKGRFAAALVMVPRARAAARDRIARAAALTDGPLVIDGPKVHGIDGLLREVGRVGTVGETIAKAHGKAAEIRGEFSEWRQEPAANGDGWVTAPGVFSADGVDPGSALLAAALPGDLTGRVVDLGAGWGYLAAKVLERPGVAEVALVEADSRALDCARRNVADPRARFFWADATTYVADPPADHVVCNPPFHQGRRADPGVGRAFIAAAARTLGPRGHLWLVANRHLPYESDLRARFAEVRELPGTPAFKLTHAARPLRPKRRRA